MPREPVTIVEIDVDSCSLSFGVAPCTAALSAARLHKCHNTFATCAAKAAFTRTPLTLRFADPRPGLPKGATIFPVLDRVTTFSQTVNIAGADDSLGPLGRRGTVTVELRDFPYHDRLTDKYQAERISGAAQFSGVGYDPAKLGTFFGKLRARWPYYAGRALRVVQGELEGGALVNTKTRNFIITEMTGDDDGRSWTFEAKDILALADDEKAVCPKPSRGALAAAITDVASSLTLTPAGEGAASYPASGRAVIGSELVSYTRSGDVLTLTGRGLGGTKAAAHSAGDAVQQTFSPVAMRVDDVLEILLRDYAGVPSAFIPKAKWIAEISRWMPQVLLTTDVCSPTGVAKLIAELSILGIAVWWDDVAQEIGLRAARPVDGESVRVLSDAANIKAISFEDRDRDRITEVMFFSVQLDPTKSANATDNYARVTLTPDLEAKGVNAFNDTRIRKVYCRWLNGGADAVVSLVSRRVLNRFSKQPIRARLRLDQKDGAISLVDVLEVQTGAFQDATGASGNRRMQAIGIAELVPGHEIEVTAQDFDFNSKYAYATENTRPVYLSSSAAQKARGMYACGNITLKMSNGDEPYRAI